MNGLSQPNRIVRDSFGTLSLSSFIASNTTFIPRAIPTSLLSMQSLISLKITNSRDSLGSSVIPLEISRLINLKTLDLSRNGIRSTIPSTMSNLPLVSLYKVQVTARNLTGNNLTGNFNPLTSLQMCDLPHSGLCVSAVSICTGASVCSSNTTTLGNNSSSSSLDAGIMGVVICGCLLVLGILVLAVYILCRPLKQTKEEAKEAPKSPVVSKEEITTIESLDEVASSPRFSRFSFFLEQFGLDSLKRGMPEVSSVVSRKTVKIIEGVGSLETSEK